MTLSRPRHEPIATAPRDGRTIEVFLAREGIWTPARWSGHAWVRSDDPERHPLHKITHWRGSLSWSAISESASEPAQPDEFAKLERSIREVLQSIEDRLIDRVTPISS